MFAGLARWIGFLTMAAGVTGLIVLAGGFVWFVSCIASDEVTLFRGDPERSPGFSIDTFPKAAQEAFLKEYNEKYPDAKRGLRGVKEEKFRPPRGYSDHDQHLQNFVEAVRSRQPVVEDAQFGLRAAMPALLCRAAFKQKRPMGWDPQTLKLVV